MQFQVQVVRSEAHMLHQSNIFIYKMRFLAVGTLTTAGIFLLAILISAVVAAFSGTVSAAPSVGTAAVEEDPNIITTGFSDAASAFGQRMNLAGSAVNGNLHFAVHVSAESGKFVGHTSLAVAGAAGHGALFAAHTGASAVMFALSLPGKSLALIPHPHISPVSAIIKPTDDKPVPVISAETSAAILARYNAKQQKEIAALQASQLAANQGLGGSIIAGDPNHGGYPAKWDNIPQDSSLDSWGMYNRECVSYAAWKAYQTFGHMPYWGGFGNANQWVGDARAAGIATGSTPQVHSVAISAQGYYGHAMWVEAVKGNMIYVSQYNYDLQGHYSEMWVNGSSFSYIYFK